jgi:hypothetical protein
MLPPSALFTVDSFPLMTLAKAKARANETFIVQMSLTIVKIFIIVQATEVGLLNI